MAARVYPKRKVDYIKRMKELLDTYTKVFIVNATHVGSKQFQDIRLALRGSGVVLMGKNTVMRKVIGGLGADSPFAALLPQIVGNIGLLFVKEDMKACRDIIGNFVVPAPARAGVVANANVIVPKGPTGCDPSQTSYFQTMEINTKISRGQIEIQTDVHLITQGERVTAGQADLLQKLGICPFTYGLAITQVLTMGHFMTWRSWTSLTTSSWLNSLFMHAILLLSDMPSTSPTQPLSCTQCDTLSRPSWQSSVTRDSLTSSMRPVTFLVTSPILLPLRQRLPLQPVRAPPRKQRPSLRRRSLTRTES